MPTAFSAARAGEFGRFGTIEANEELMSRCISPQFKLKVDRVDR